MQNNNEYFINSENSILEDNATKDLVKKHHGEFNKYRPQFKARPANYYADTWCDKVLQVLILFPCYIVSGILLYAFVLWGLQNTRTFGYICISVWIAYICFIGTKIKNEKKTIPCYMEIIYNYFYQNKLIY